jgi:activator of 2-hydroxyglutaryl-CoA dehydratase
VVGLVTRSARREDIARAVHRAVVMLRRNGVAGPVVFDCLRRRCARNRCLVGLVREGLGGEVFVPEDPQMVGALGAALAGHEVHPVA